MVGGIRLHHECLLSDVEIQLNDTNLVFHDAALLLNRLEISVSILRSLADISSDDLEH